MEVRTEVQILNAKALVGNTQCSYQNRTGQVPITKKLLRLARSATASMYSSRFYENMMNQIEGRLRLKGKRLSWQSRKWPIGETQENVLRKQ